MFDIPDVDFLEQIYDSATVRLAPNDTEIATITFDTGVAQGSITSLQQNNLVRTRDCLPKLKPQKKVLCINKRVYVFQRAHRHWHLPKSAVPILFEQSIVAKVSLRIYGPFRRRTGLFCG